MVVVVLMGVCGCGKTTVGEALAARLGCLFADADDFHSEENKQKMRSAIPLTDEDRRPWLNKIHEHIKSAQSKSQNCVVTCSALKKLYRDILHSGTSARLQPQAVTTDQPPLNDTVLPLSPTKLSDILFVHLKGARNVLEKRMAGRKGHFMSPDLLTSQLAILEEPGSDENYLSVDIASSVSDIVEVIVKHLQGGVCGDA